MFITAKERHKNSTQKDGKNLQENIGNLFMNFMQRVFSPFVRYWITLLSSGTGSSQFLKMSAMLSNCVTDPPEWFCDPLWKVGDR